MVYVPREIFGIILKQRKILMWNYKFRNFEFAKMELYFDLRGIESWAYYPSTHQFNCGVEIFRGQIDIRSRRWYEWKAPVEILFYNTPLLDVLANNFSTVEVLGNDFDVVYSNSDGGFSGDEAELMDDEPVTEGNRVLRLRGFY
jgi:hypothetical protein